MKTAAFCSLSIFSGLDALVGKIISFTVIKEKIESTAATRYKFDAILKPSASCRDLRNTGRYRRGPVPDVRDFDVIDFIYPRPTLHSNILSPRVLRRRNVTPMTCATKVREKITGLLVLPPNFKTVQCFHDPFSDFPGN